MQHQLPPLPYSLNALEPHMSAETLEFHHGKHHKAYVDKLNELIKNTEHENMDLEEIVRTASQGPIFNNAAQAWNHAFFWQCLSPHGGRAEGELGRAIDASFGSFDAFKSKFTKTAVELFGSGWAWLVRGKDGSLSIEPMPDAGTPIAHGKHALLTCDVWEHAYYIDYRNARPKFLEAFWKIVNWDFVAQNFAQARGARVGVAAASH